MVRKLPLKTPRKNKVGLLLIVGFIGIVILTVINEKHRFTSLTSGTESYSEEGASDITDVQECSENIYVDKQVGFSVMCHDTLKVYAYRDKYNPYLKKQEKILFLCESQITTDTSQGYYLCPAGGIMIWANGDGWGGGGGEKETVVINGKTYMYSLYSTGFGQLYLGDAYGQNHRNEFLIEGSFSTSFTKEAALKVVKSFKIL